MSETIKIPAEYDYQQTLRRSYNLETASMSVDGFLAGKIGRKVVQTIVTTTFPNDTLVFDFQEKDATGAYITLYQLTIIFIDSGRSEMLSAERTA